MTYKEWIVKCVECDSPSYKRLAWNNEFPLLCPECHCHAEVPYNEHRNQSAGIATDDIPGGIEIRHGEGLINADGSPKKYYSKTELKRACNEHNWTIGGDTPKPYRVSWDGRRKDKFAPHE